MKVKKLYLKDFRNYGECLFEFGEGINILYGENAQGKTNVIEALYLFSSARSHRGSKDREMITFNKDEAELKITFDSQMREQESALKLYKEKNRKLFINEIEQKYQKALLGIFATVIFSPADLSLVKDGPEERRRFADTDISQIRPNYFGILKEYKKVIELKTNLLKSEIKDDSLIEVYNEKIASLSAKITVHRHRFCEELSKLTSAALKYISSNVEGAEIVYKIGASFDYSLNPKEISEKYKKELEEVKENEKQKGVCLIGPHRDDFIFYLNGKEARSFASQGQQRSLVMALKLAEFEFMKEILGEPPILLLDDIFSELDIKRQEKLLGFLNNKQVIITCTDRDHVEKIKFPSKLFRIKNGEILNITYNE